MTEYEWWTSNDEIRMIRCVTTGVDPHLAGQHQRDDVYFPVGSERQKKMIAAQTCLLAWSRLSQSDQYILRVAEDFADRNCDQEKLIEIYSDEVSERALMNISPELKCDVVREIMGDPRRPVKWSSCGECHGSGWKRKADLDNAGSYITYPCKRCGPSPNVVRVAKAIYQDRDFASFPILLDALEDMDYHEEQVIRHLQGKCPIPWCQDTGGGYGYWHTRKDKDGNHIVVSIPPPVDLETPIQRHNCPHRDNYHKDHRPFHCRGCWALDLILGGREQRIINGVIQ